jgi:hypothetical protein
MGLSEASAGGGWQISCKVSKTLVVGMWFQIVSSCSLRRWLPEILMVGEHWYALALRFDDSVRMRGPTLIEFAAVRIANDNT